jgi:gliding motility-associated-like protein
MDGPGVIDPDFSQIPDSITFLSGIDTASITLSPLVDLLTEGPESIIITSTFVNACGVTIISADSLYIDDTPILTSITTDTSFSCPSTPILISALVTGSIEPYTYVWTDTQGNTYPDTADIVVPTTQTDTFYVNATGHCNLITVTDTIIVNVTPLYTLSSTQSDTNNCVGDMVDLRTSPSLPGTYTYSWALNPTTGLLSTPNDSTCTATLNSDGTNQIIVTVDNGGINCIVQDTMYVNTNLIPIITAFSSDTTICINGATTLFANAIGTPPVSLIWDNGLVGNGPHQVNPTFFSTLYTVFAQDANGCVSPTQNIIITLEDSIKIDTMLLTDPTICLGTTTTLLVDAHGGGTGLIYTWLDGNNTIIGSTDTGAYTVTPSYDGEIFTVIVSDSCTTPSDTANIITDWSDIVSPSYIVNDSVGCFDKIKPFITNTTPNLGSMTNVHWDFGDGNTFDSPFSYQIDHSYDAPGLYDITLTVTDQYGCEWDTIMANYQIDAHGYPTADFAWNPNPADYLNAQITFNNQSTGNVFNEWLFITDAAYTSNAFDPVLQFPQNQPGNYDVTLTVTNKHGCRDSITKVIVIDDVFLFYIPTAFTPDGDGLNDNFKVVGEGLDLTNFKMRIFNKWGELIFESSNPDTGWDGTYKGSLVPDGVYIWKIDAQEAHSPVIQRKDGFITIMR